MKFFVEREFKGYETIEILDQKGRKRKELVYLDEYYHLNLSKRANRRIRALWVCAAVCLWGLFIFAATRPVPSNLSKLVGVPAILSMFPKFFCIIGAIYGLVSPEMMERNEFRRSVQFIQYGSAANGGYMSAIALCHMIFVAVNSDTTAISEERIVLLCYLAEILLSWSVSIMTGRIPKTVIPGTRSLENDRSGCEPDG